MLLALRWLMGAGSSNPCEARWEAVRTHSPQRCCEAGGARAQHLLVPPCPRWGDPEHPQRPGHPDSLPASRTVSSPFSCLICDVDITDRKQIGFLSLASRVSFLANLKAHSIWQASPVPSAWGGLWLLSEQASTGKACAGSSLPIVRQSRSACTAPGNSDELHQQPFQKEPFICIQ